MLVLPGVGNYLSEANINTMKERLSSGPESEAGQVRIVARRSGPTPIIEIGAPTRAAMRSR